MKPLHTFILIFAMGWLPLAAQSERELGTIWGMFAGPPSNPWEVIRVTLTLLESSPSDAAGSMAVQLAFSQNGTPYQVRLSGAELAQFKEGLTLYFAQEGVAQRDQTMALRQLALLHGQARWRWQDRWLEGDGLTVVRMDFFSQHTGDHELVLTFAPVQAVAGPGVFSPAALYLDKDDVTLLQALLTAARLTHNGQSNKKNGNEAG